MRFNLFNQNSPPHLLHLAIKDACDGFESASSMAEADSIVTIDEFRLRILEGLEPVLTKNEKSFITAEFLKEELIKNNLVPSTIIYRSNLAEVWLIKKKIKISSSI